MFKSIVNWGLLLKESAACYDVEKQYLHHRSLISLEYILFRYIHEYLYVKLMQHLCICFTMEIMVMASDNIGCVYEFTVKKVFG